MINLTPKQLSILNLYEDSTYGIALEMQEAIPLIEMGLIEWVPPKFGTVHYAITEKGIEIRDDHNYARAREG